MDKTKKRKRKKKNTALKVILLSLLGIVIAVGVFGTWYVLQNMNKLNANAVPIVEKPTDPPSEMVDISTPAPEEIAAQATPEPTPEATEYPIWAVDSIDDRIINILLIGIDYRDDEDASVTSSDTKASSDSMMLVSCNLETKRVCIFSIMRDGGAYLTNKTWYDKINKAYANYGVGGLINCINGSKNFDLDVQNYISVSFRMFTHILKHYIGNLDIDLTAEECRFINKWAEWNMLEVRDGVQSVPPYGVLFYCRDRYSADLGDYGRTARQRHVLELLYQKVKNEMSLTTLAKMIDYVATTAATNLSAQQMLQLAQIALSEDFTIESTTIPFPGMGHNGTNSDGNFLLTYDMKKAREILHGIIYNGDEMPESVQSNSYAEQSYGVQKTDDSSKNSKATPAPASADSQTEDTPAPADPPNDSGQGSEGSSGQPAPSADGDSGSGEG